MQTVTTIGLDIAKSVGMALMLLATWSSAVGSGAGVLPEVATLPDRSPCVP
jgi:hypothetical protein